MCMCNVSAKLSATISYSSPCLCAVCLHVLFLWLVHTWGDNAQCHPILFCQSSSSASLSLLGVGHCTDPMRSGRELFDGDAWHRLCDCWPYWGVPIVTFVTINIAEGKMFELQMSAHRNIQITLSYCAFHCCTLLLSLILKNWTNAFIAHKLTSIAHLQLKNFHVVTSRVHWLPKARFPLRVN